MAIAADFAWFPMLSPWGLSGGRKGSAGEGEEAPPPAAGGVTQLEKIRILMRLCFSFSLPLSKRWSNYIFDVFYMFAFVCIFHGFLIRSLFFSPAP